VSVWRTNHSSRTKVRRCNCDNSSHVQYMYDPAAQQSQSQNAFHTHTPPYPMTSCLLVVLSTHPLLFPLLLCSHTHIHWHLLPLMSPGIYHHIQNHWLVAIVPYGPPRLLMACSLNAMSPYPLCMFVVAFVMLGVGVLSIGCHCLIWVASDQYQHICFVGWYEAGWYAGTELWLWHECGSERLNPWPWPGVTYR